MNTLTWGNHTPTLAAHKYTVDLYNLLSEQIHYMLETGKMQNWSWSGDGITVEFQRHFARNSHENTRIMLLVIDKTYKVYGHLAFIKVYSDGTVRYEVDGQLLSHLIDNRHEVLTTILNIKPSTLKTLGVTFHPNW